MWQIVCRTREEKHVLEPKLNMDDTVYWRSRTRALAVSSLVAPELVKPIEGNITMKYENDQDVINSVIGKEKLYNTMIEKIKENE